MAVFVKSVNKPGPLSGVFGLIFAICFLISVIYGGYWVTKNVSYKIFYEDMVEQTVTEMVKQDSLR